MNAISLKHIAVSLSLAAFCAAAGPLASAQTTRPAAATAPATNVDFSKPVAVINGREINNEAFYDLLMQVAGNRVYEEVRDYILIQQACAAAGIDTSGPAFDKSVQAELERALEGISKQTGIPMTDRQQVVAILNQTLAKNNVVEAEFRLGLQRAAALRALAQGHVEVTPDEMKQAFEAQYGEKVKVDVLSVPDMTTAAEVRKLVSEGKKPLEINQSRGIPIQSITISKNADQIAKIRDPAFALSPGQLSSAIPQGNGFVLVYLEEKVPPRAGNFNDPAVQADLKKFVYDVKEQQWMAQHLRNLEAMANIKINDPVLSAIIEANYRASRAATQPATQPAAAPGAAAPTH